MWSRRNPDAQTGPDETIVSAKIIALPTPTAEDSSITGRYLPSAGPPDGVVTGQDNDSLVQFPAPKTSNLKEILDDQNLDRLQPRISQEFTPPITRPKFC